MDYGVDAECFDGVICTCAHFGVQLIKRVYFIIVVSFYINAYYKLILDSI